MILIGKDGNVKISREDLIDCGAAISRCVQQGPVKWRTTPGLAVAAIGFLYGRMIRDAAPKDRVLLETAFRKGQAQGHVTYRRKCPDCGVQAFLIFSDGCCLACTESRTT